MSLKSILTSDLRMPSRGRKAGDDDTETELEPGGGEILAAASSQLPTVPAPVKSEPVVETPPAYAPEAAEHVPPAASSEAVASPPVADAPAASAPSHVTEPATPAAERNVPSSPAFEAVSEPPRQAQRESLDAEPLATAAPAPSATPPRWQTNPRWWSNSRPRVFLRRLTRQRREHPTPPLTRT